ncbi:hypothetical protein [Kitasatospora herbaricolor]|uniref:hypothetical protein n=2 Tax=Kitasatospora herbaricolor TaxID=68217 RepID=UPI0036DA8427
MPTMTCEGCGRQVPWNPFACCGWTCFTRPRDPDEEMTEVAAAAPAALAYFFRLRRGYRVHGGRLPAAWAARSGGSWAASPAGPAPEKAAPATDSGGKDALDRDPRASAAGPRAPFRPSWAGAGVGTGTGGGRMEPLAMVWLSRTGGRADAGPAGPAAAVRAALSECRRRWGWSLRHRPGTGA